jgi:hypothetical protein
VKVTGPDGATYSIYRRWLPWRWRRRISARPWDSVGLGLDAGPEDLGGMALALILTVVVALVAPILLLVLLSGIEFLLLLIVLPLSVLGRLVFRQHWHVEVRRQRHLICDIDSGDWATSRTVIADLAERLRLGRLDPEELTSYD